VTKTLQIEGVSEFFADGNVAVIGVGQGFRILEELERATSIRLAMAFCHLSGWSRFEAPIKKCAGDVYLLTGLDFCQTEPRLLREWDRLSTDRRFQPRLVTTKSGIFHPKVLIVSSPLKTFALVGSPPLSRTNGHRHHEGYQCRRVQWRPERVPGFS
jgi:HKD family nuclease